MSVNIEELPAARQGIYEANEIRLLKGAVREILSDAHSDALQPEWVARCILNAYDAGIRDITALCRIARKETSMQQFALRAAQEADGSSQRKDALR